jgi:hypothetical protein
VARHEAKRREAKGREGKGREGKGREAKRRIVCKGRQSCVATSSAASSKAPFSLVFPHRYPPILLEFVESAGLFDWLVVYMPITDRLKKERKKFERRKKIERGRKKPVAAVRGPNTHRKRIKSGREGQTGHDDRTGQEAR